MKPRSDKHKEVVEARLEADDLLLKETFPDIGSFVDISGPLSDLHEAHSAVYRVKFDRGDLIYKPRSLKVDKVFSDISHQLFGTPPRPIVNLGSHGWMAFYNDEPVAEKTSYWLGEQLALLTTLRSSDHHGENIIISKGRPLFIDMECSLAPEMSFAPRQDQSFSINATRVFQNPKIKFSNTEVELGYEAGKKLIRQNEGLCRKAILSLSSEPLRVVLRNTSFYVESLEFLKGLDDVTVAFQEMCEILDSVSPGMEDLIRYEAKCLCEGRVPRFTYTPDSTLLRGENQIFENLISHPGLPLALKYL